MSAYDIIMHNHVHGAKNETHKPRTIRMSDADHEPEDPNFDWDARKRSTRLTTFEKATVS
jgi:hypothetical protein